MILLEIPKHAFRHPQESSRVKMTAVPNIEVRPVTRENWREALSLGVRADQQHFVAEHAPIALVGLAKAQVGAHGFTWLPFMFFDESVPVGFAMVAYEDPKADCCWIFHFFIDARFQRRGLGSLALRQLLGTLRACGEWRFVRLTVHPDNVAARQFYLAIGFEPRAEQAFGEPVLELSLE